MSQTTKQIRTILKQIARVENSDNDTKEIVYDRELSKINQLDRANIIEAVRQAVGSDSKLARYAPFVFSELADEPGIERIFTEVLENADDVGRNSIIQTIGLRRMKTLVGVLNGHFARETDDFCRDQLLWTLGKIADESSLPIFLSLMRKNEERDRWRILCAARNYARIEFKDYLVAVFETDDKKSNKIIAAWGLAKLGSAKGYDYLISMLDDPERVITTDTTTTYDPGEAIRAAQAISDINGWEFEWNTSSVDMVRKRLTATNQ